MSDDVKTCIIGHTGRITLTRPKALNALSYPMCLEIEAALDAWRDDDAVKMVVIDAEGERAFCAGGDIASIYHDGIKGIYDHAQKFWRDEYRMNAKLFEFPKPVAAFMHGFVMGGGVGVGCHGSHRIVGDTTQMSMPECGIGLIPDVGGTLLLAQAPGRLGEFLGLTGERMGAADAIYAGFADYYIPEADWPAVIAELENTGDWEAIDRAAKPVGEARLKGWQADIDSVFGGERIGDVFRAISADPPEAIAHAQKALSRNSPLSMACTLELIHRVRMRPTIHNALEQEYRFTSRAAEFGDFVEGVRAAIIDKDRNPTWKHASWEQLPSGEVTQMLLPVTGENVQF
ncbi:enoyl-CoA hydratase/isomerase family protein [Marivivens donghaensis]|uniref:3-hydroxyisobutyryl-CoA hydrolase n=1 Tax=Marivivens donghaensis TaxID=1699413 RepID=A0ABX0VY12_9RHOB|nr:enoyl-CoA hydratase/isomerase family protein [Marivivens donghaensis]NIY72709.1 enoyl-CoA hydratase/isomerase family protein [Marivivens donghaensis]